MIKDELTIRNKYQVEVELLDEQCRGKVLDLTKKEQAKLESEIWSKMGRELDALTRGGDNANIFN